MIYAAPHYYKDFKCVADKCPDTCCSKWQIAIDDNTLNKYMNITGSERNRYINSIDMETRSFCHYDNKCAFLDEDGLCDIQKDKGSNWLCKTCRNYPRHVEEFENVREYSISMSCPEAARIILFDPDFDKFDTRTDDREEEYEYFYIDLYEALVCSRKFILKHILQSDSGYRTKMAFSLLFAHDIQARVDRGRPELVKNFVNKCIRNINSEKNVEKLSQYSDSEETVRNTRNAMTELFAGIEMIDCEWCSTVLERIKNLQELDNKAYYDKEYNFYKVNDRVLSQIVPAFMAYLVTVYYCGAVYDYDAYAKMKFCCVNTLMFMEILKAFSDTESGEIDEETVIDIAHRYSREVEHTVTNIEYIENKLIYSGDLELKSILACVLK